jgi:hypothetical protein
MSNDDDIELETDMDEQREQYDGEQIIFASYAGIDVEVVGTDADDVQENFEHVWSTMMETHDKIVEVSEHVDMPDDDEPSGRTFGD